MSNIEAVLASQPTDLSETAKSVIMSRYSENTKRAYTAQWRAFVGQVGDRAAMPADPTTVANYLAWLAGKGRKMATIKLALAAIGAAHMELEQDNPCRSKVVRDTMMGLSRTLTTAQKQAKALDGEALRKIKKTACRPRTYVHYVESTDQAYERGIMDIALCCTASDSGLRVSELAGLVWADLSFWEDGGGSVYIGKSKNDPYGEGDEVALTADTVRSLMAIRGDCGEDDLVFGLGPQAISNRIRNAAQHAGLGDGYSGHSGRVGMAQRMTEAGAPIQAVMRQGRWKSEKMVGRYTRRLNSRNALDWL